MELARQDNHHPSPPIPHMPLPIRPPNLTVYLALMLRRVLQDNHSQVGWSVARRLALSNDFQMVPRSISLLLLLPPHNHRATLNNLRRVRWANLVALRI
jgi:hypothetical protein